MASDELRIAVHRASGTLINTLLVSEHYKMKLQLPFVPGTDAAG